MTLASDAGIIQRQIARTHLWAHLNSLVQQTSRRTGFFPLEEVTPVKGVVCSTWLKTKLEWNESAVARVNRIAIKVSVLLALRERL